MYIHCIYYLLELLLLLVSGGLVEGVADEEKAEGLLLKAGQREREREANRQAGKDRDTNNRHTDTE